MKKTYKKPDIIFESFTLSSSIAAGCEAIIDGQSGRTCGLSWGYTEIFTQDVDGCVKKVIDGAEEYDELCYHVPTDFNNVFNS